MNFELKLEFKEGLKLGLKLHLRHVGVRQADKVFVPASRDTFTQTAVMEQTVAGT